MLTDVGSALLAIHDPPAALGPDVQWPARDGFSGFTHCPGRSANGHGIGVFLFCVGVCRTWCVVSSRMSQLLDFYKDGFVSIFGIPRSSSASCFCFFFFFFFVFFFFFCFFLFLFGIFYVYWLLCVVLVSRRMMVVCVFGCGPAPNGGILEVGDPYLGAEAAGFVWAGRKRFGSSDARL